MALGFFRRRQKMVIIIMVALMVSFLVGSYGFNMLFSTDPMKREIGRTRTGELLRRDWVFAEAELDVLAGIGLGGNPYRYPPWPTEMAYLLVRRNGQQDAYAYMLLLAEARGAGILVSETDVDAFFAEIGCFGDSYKQLLSELRERRRWTEQEVRQAVRNWLLVNKSFVESNVSCPPSEAEILLTYRDVTEQIDLRVMRLDAKDYVKDVPDPNQAAIDEHFNRYRTRFPGRTRKVDDMGFGYRQPGRARVQYLFVRGDVLERITEPASDLVIDYYNRNKSEFVKKVPIGPPVTRPAGGAASEPASRPTRDVRMTFAEAKEQIIEKLRSDAVQARMDGVVSLVENKVGRFLADKGDPNQAFASVREEMTRSAEKALAVVLRGVKIDGGPLDEAVARLAAAAKLRAICYPWGTHGGQTLLPSVKITLQADGITLGEALARIGEQAKWPPEGSGKLHWAMCEGFKGVLFSVGAKDRGVDFFPLSVNQTAPSTFQELSEDEILGYAFANPAGGRTLAQIAFSAKGLSTDPRETAMATVGAMGTRMYVMGDKSGRLVWRLVEIEEEHMPRELADRPELRRRVVEDLKLLAAFKKATEAAGTLKDAAETVSLEAVAEGQKKETYTTGMFARKTFSGAWSNVPKLDLPTPELRAHVISKAFSLTPKDVEPTAPKGPAAVLVVPVSVKGEVFVMERIDFRPVVRPEYEEFGRLATARFLNYSRQQALQAIWFDLRGIRQRVGLTNP